MCNISSVGSFGSCGIMIFPILFCLIIIVMLFKFRKNNSLEILKEKLAKGDITEEDFKRKKELLKNNSCCK